LLDEIIPHNVAWQKHRLLTDLRIIRIYTNGRPKIGLARIPCAALFLISETFEPQPTSLLLKRLRWSFVLGDVKHSAHPLKKSSERLAHNATEIKIRSSSNLDRGADVTLRTKYVKKYQAMFTNQQDCTK
jgi:hypothetical protein